MLVMPKQNTVSDHRMQIYLPRDLYTLAKQKASQEKVSLAEIIRQSLEKNLVPMEKNKPKNLLESLSNVTGIIKDGPTDMSVNLNKYLKEMYESKL